MLVGRPGDAVAYARRVVSLDPSRLVLLPLDAARRRVLRTALGIAFSVRRRRAAI
jgi:hypothetical protein